MKSFLAWAIALCASATSTLAVSAEPVTLKLAFFASAREVNYDKVIKPWVEAVNADPSGAIRIEAYPDGALGKSLPAQPQMLLDGVADIGWVNPSLIPGRFPDDDVLELPGLVNSIEEGVALYSNLIAKGDLKGYDDYFVIGSFMNPSYNIFSRRPTTSLADLSGQKVRIVGPVVGQTVKALGMVPVMMPPPEIVEAIGRGTIDAATLVPAALLDFGVDRVTTNDFLIPLGAGPLTLLMNRAKFDTLPPEAKQVIEKYSGDWVNDLFVRELTAYNDAVVAGLKNDGKRTVTDLSAEDRAKLDEVSANVVAGWQAQSPENAELLGKVREFLSSLRDK